MTVTSTEPSAVPGRCLGDQRLGRANRIGPRPGPGAVDPRSRRSSRGDLDLARLDGEPWRSRI